MSCLLHIDASVPKKTMKDQVTGMFKKKVSIFFCCSITKLPVASGKDGMGYQTEIPSQLLKKLSPIIKVANCADMTDFLFCFIPNDD